MSRHMNSSMWEGSRALAWTPCRRSHLFSRPQYAATAFLHTPVVGSTKFWEWLTVRWSYPAARSQYPRHWSVNTVVPGATYLRTSSVRVLASRNSTYSTAKKCFILKVIILSQRNDTENHYEIEKHMSEGLKVLKYNLYLSILKIINVLTDKFPK